MASPIIVSSQTILEGYSPTTDILYWDDNVRGGMFSFYPSGYTVDNGIVFASTLPGGGYWVRQFAGDIFPQWFIIPNDGTAIPPTNLAAWMDACKTFNKRVYLPEGTYCFPMDFQHPFGDFDLEIAGVRGQTTITTYEFDMVTHSYVAATNFAVPPKVDFTKPVPPDGIYQVDITAPVINPAFSPVSSSALDSYIQITGGVPSPITSLSVVKAAGYVTELNVVASGAPMDDGLYVVAKHPFDPLAYGGSFTHLDLNGLTGWPTSGPVLYLQGTILQKTGGTLAPNWSRYFSGGGGFGTTGNMVVKDIIFDNVRFYLFSPFDLASPNPDGQTSDTLSITGCVFRNCARILSSITYAGITVPTNWFANVYNAGGKYRFRNFTMADNDFSYIHESLCWGPPPALHTLITNNCVHDCYTILTSFFLYMPKPANTANFWFGKITQTITDNSFIRIRPLNSAATATTCIIRTCGNAIVNDNIYLDITQQAIYISSINSTFNGNSVTKFIEDYSESPVMLVKVVDDQGVVEISGNAIVSPQSDLVQIEGFASFNIVGNTYVGCTKGRLITQGTTEISTLKVYQVQNTGRYQTLAGSGNWLPVTKGKFTYFDKRRNLWVEMTIQPPASYMFSKSYNTTADAAKEFVIIESNTIETETITRLGNSIAGTKFHLIAVRNNSIQYSLNLHLGNKVIVEEYVCTGNYLKNGSLSMASNDPFTYQIKSMFFENNQIAKSLGIVFLFAYKDLVFKNNTHFIDEDIVQSYYADLGIFVPPAIYNPPVIFGIKLQGYGSCKMIIENNRVMTIHSKSIALQIDTAADLEINNNIFDLKTYGFTNTGITTRNAVMISPSGNINLLAFTGNTIYAETGAISNRLLEFDAAPNTISAITVNDNKVPVQPAGILTIVAAGKVVTTYYKGTNFYPGYPDTFGAPPPLVVAPI